MALRPAALERSSQPSLASHTGPKLSESRHAGHGVRVAGCPTSGSLTRWRAGRPSWASPWASATAYSGARLKCGSARGMGVLAPTRAAEPGRAGCAHGNGRQLGVSSLTLGVPNRSARYRQGRGGPRPTRQPRLETRGALGERQIEGPQIASGQVVTRRLLGTWGRRAPHGAWGTAFDIGWGRVGVQVRQPNRRPADYDNAPGSGPLGLCRCNSTPLGRFSVRAVSRGSPPH